LWTQKANGSHITIKETKIEGLVARKTEDYKIYTIVKRFSSEI
jgi:hypothetical protein